MPLKTALILNSRQSKTPTGSDPWVRATIDAVRCLTGDGFRIIGSVGMNTWELTSYAISENNTDGIFLLPDAENSYGDFCREFDFHESFHEFIRIKTPANSRSGKSWWTERDKSAFQMADIIVPISVRKSGNLETLMNSSDTKFCTDFRIEYDPSAENKWHVPICDIQFPGWNYFTHWTCRSYSPWPGETLREYYRSVVSGGNTYSHSALNTLRRILSEKKIRGSSLRMREKKPAVSFTSLPPHDAVKLMQWRSRFCRPTFEPYGIAISSETAINRGIRPVTYLDSANIPAIEPAYLQGCSKADWTGECEWRIVGDFDLSSIPENEAIVLVQNQSEAEEISRITDFPVMGLADFNSPPYLGKAGYGKHAEVKG